MLGLVFKLFSKRYAFVHSIANFEIPICWLCKGSNVNNRYKLLLYGTNLHPFEKDFQQDNEHFSAFASCLLLIFGFHFDLPVRSVALPLQPFPSNVFLPLLSVLCLKAHGTKNVGYNQQRTYSARMDENSNPI